MAKKFYGIKFTHIYGDDLIDYFTAIERDDFDKDYMIGYALRWINKNNGDFGDCFLITFYDEYAEEIDRIYIA